jgi:hypothetical protein
LRKTFHGIADFFNRNILKVAFQVNYFFVINEFNQRIKINKVERRKLK